MNVDDCVRLHEKSFFNKIYLVSGLRRSGNHLLLQILNCSFSDNSILFINDFPSLKNDDNYKDQFIQFKKNGYIKKSLIEISYNNSSFFCGADITNKNKLIKIEDINDLYNKSSLWINNKTSIQTNNKVLIMSFEDQHISVMDEISEVLINKCNNLYKIIIIRDILNCFASRFAALCDRDNKYKYDLSEDKKIPDINYSNLVKLGGFFKTDMDTYNLWLEHNSYFNNTNYITFNYNKFLCLSNNYKIDLFNKLDISYNPVLFTEKSTYGQGSSFSLTKEKQDDYFWRFSSYICSQITNTTIIKKINIDFMTMLKKLLNDPIIKIILEKEFNIHIIKMNNIITNKEERFKNPPTYTITICSEKRVVSFPEFLFYMNKYLKYKTKYLEYKNLIK